jgi:hypothetical protein
MRRLPPLSGLVMVLLVLCTAEMASAQTEETIRLYDANQDGRYDEVELTALFFDHDPEILQLRASGTPETALKKIARDRAVDVLTLRCDSCTIAPLADVLLFVEERAWALGVTRKRLGWSTLAFRRFVTDTADPRQLSPDKRPFIFSYKRDNAATDKDQVNILGGIQAYKWLVNFGDVNIPRHFVSAAPGVELDIDGSKKPFESSIEFGVPLAYEYAREGRLAVSGFIASLTPKYLTDRDFERSGWEIVYEGSLNSLALGRMGYTTWLGRSNGPSSAIFAIYWRPSFRLETREITDAAGNEKLAALAKEGKYTRPTPRLTAVGRFERWLPALTLNFDYFHRMNGPDDLTYGYGETRFTYDLTADRTFSFGLVITRGRKPPDFARTDRVLIGFGFLQP